MFVCIHGVFAYIFSPFNDQSLAFTGRERLCLAFNLVVKGWKGKGWFERGWKGRLWFECLDLVLVFGSCFAVLGCEEGVLSLKVCSLFH